MLDLEKAREELKDKSYSQIQTETAWTWGSRACVSYEHSTTLSGSQQLAVFCVAEELFHEALEHAALSEDETLVKAIRDAVNPYQEKAAALVMPSEIKG